MIKRLNSFLIVSSILVLFLSSGTEAVAWQSGNVLSVVERTDGTSFEGQLELANDTIVKVLVGDKEEVVRTESVGSIRFAEKFDADDESSIRLWLVDGSIIRCESFTVTDRKLVATTECESRISVDTRLVDTVKMVSGDEAFEQQWAKTVAENRESDALVVNRNQKLQMVDGIVGDVSNTAVKFTVGERTADVKRERLTGLLFYRRYSEGPLSTNFVVELVDGSKIRSQSMKAIEKEFEVVTTCGAKLNFEPQVIASVDFQEGRSVWITDLDPSGNSWAPLLAGSNVLDKLKQFSIARFDKSYGGKPLALLSRNETSDSLGRQEYPRGFAIKGGGKLSYVLAKQYRRLTGSIGFDPDANSTGVVKLVVQVDGVNRIEEVLEASTMDRPFELELDVADASRVVFNVEYHDRRSVGDILHAVEMKLHR